MVASRIRLSNLKPSSTAYKWSADSTSALALRKNNHGTYNANRCHQRHLFDYSGYLAVCCNSMFVNQNLLGYFTCFINKTWMKFDTQPIFQIQCFLCAGGREDYIRSVKELMACLLNLLLEEHEFLVKLLVDFAKAFNDFA